MNALNTFLFVVFPYAAFAVCVIGTIYRWKQTGFKVSSLSSQFLEGNKLFWGVVPFHFGLLVVLGGHLVAFLLPNVILGWNAEPWRLIILEVTAFVFGISILLGLGQLIFRRLTDPRIKVVTSNMDIAVELLLLAQVILGCVVALGFRWGSSWFAADLTPYLQSLFVLQPETSAVFELPWLIKLHIFGAFLIMFMVPFTRLVHFVVAPLHYITRPYQQVIWNWNKDKIRDPATAWSEKRPKNN
ncbi:MAG TPA: respiratory nitrate reductase subunit gamma [Myxococcota bacterium]|nr:respiratory nitrate reductase subunit gamma [Myxococcota bacterium]